MTDNRQIVDDMLDRVWKRVKDDTLTAEKIQSLAQTGIELGSVNIEKMLKTKYEHHADESDMFKFNLKELVPTSSDYVPTPELESYLYNTACQQNLRTMKDAVKKLFNLP